METRQERKEWLEREIKSIEEYWFLSGDPERLDRAEKYGFRKLQEKYQAELKRSNGYRDGY